MNETSKVHTLWDNILPSALAGSWSQRSFSTALLLVAVTMFRAGTTTINSHRQAHELWLTQSSSLSSLSLSLSLRDVACVLVWSLDHHAPLPAADPSSHSSRWTDRPRYVHTHTHTQGKKKGNIQVKYLKIVLKSSAWVVGSILDYFVAGLSKFWHKEVNFYCKWISALITNNQFWYEPWKTHICGPLHLLIWKSSHRNNVNVMWRTVETHTDVNISVVCRTIKRPGKWAAHTYW